MKKIFYSFLIIAFFFISASLFGEETGLQVGNAGEGGGTFTFYDVVFGNGMIGILIWGLLFVTSTAALAITIRAIWSLRQSRFLTPGFTEQILPLFESKDYQGAYNACVGSPALTKKIVREVLLFPPPKTVTDMFSTSSTATDAGALWICHAPTGNTVPVSVMLNPVPSSLPKSPAVSPSTACS